MSNFPIYPTNPYAPFNNPLGAFEQRLQQLEQTLRQPQQNIQPAINQQPTQPPQTQLQYSQMDLTQAAPPQTENNARVNVFVVENEQQALDYPADMVYGRLTLFPQQDGSTIYAKRWDMGKGMLDYAIFHKQEGDVDNVVPKQDGLQMAALFQDMAELKTLVHELREVIENERDTKRSFAGSREDVAIQKPKGARDIQRSSKSAKEQLSGQQTSLE